MAKKNLGRVKRYKSSFYRSRGYHVRRLAIGLAVLAAIFALGWFIGPAVIDFGTSTWYSWKNGSSRSEPVNSDESLSGPMVTETPAPTPTPEPTPTPVGMEADSRWSWVDLSAVSTEQAARATAQQLAGQGVQYAVLTLKDDGGSLYYASAQELAARSLSEAAIDPAAAVAILKEEGVTAVAQLAMYRDPVAPYTDGSRTAAIHYEDTDYFWLDAAAENGGKPWLNPYSDLAFQYLDGLVGEVLDMGFEQLILTDVQLPNGVSARCNYGLTDGVAARDQLASIIGRWQQEADERGAAVWFEYPLAVAGSTREGGSPQLDGATPDALGIEKLLITLPAEQDETTAAQLEAARAASASAEYRAVRTGSEAVLDR